MHGELVNPTQVWATQDFALCNRVWVAARIIKTTAFSRHTACKLSCKPRKCNRTPKA